MNPLDFIFPQWVKHVALGLGAVALAAGLLYAKHKYDASVRAPVERELKMTSDFLGACRKNGEALKTSIDKQNNAIDALLIQADKLKLDSKKAAAEAKNLTTKSDQRVKEILASAPLNADLCESARLRLVPQ